MLGDALVRVQLSRVPHRDVHRVLHEIARQPLHLLGPRRREEQGLALARHFIDDGSNLRLEAHVQHAVGLVEGEGHDVRHVDLAHLHDVVEAAGGGDDDLYAALDGLDLRILGRTACTDVAREED